MKELNVHLVHEKGITWRKHLIKSITPVANPCLNREKEILYLEDEKLQVQTSYHLFF